LGSAYKIRVRNSEGKRPCGRCRHTWDDDIKIDIKEMDLKMWTE
jgi:hypothetical protein